MTHPAFKYDPINRDFPSPEDEREEDRQDTREGVLFLIVIVFAVLTTAVGVITVTAHYAKPLGDFLGGR